MKITPRDAYRLPSDSYLSTAPGADVYRVFHGAAKIHLAPRSELGPLAALSPAPTP